MIFVPYFIGERSRDHARLASGELVAPELPAADAEQRLAVLSEELAAGVAASERPRVQAGDCVATLGVAAGLQRRGVDFHPVWLDAHGGTLIADVTLLPEPDFTSAAHRDPLAHRRQRRARGRQTDAGV